MKYIESTPLPDGTYDHTEVRAAYEIAYRVEYWGKDAKEWLNTGYHIKEYETMPFRREIIYRAQVPNTYGIHESSSTLREVKVDAGPAVAEMLLDRIKELEDDLSYALGELDNWASYGNGADPEMDEKLIKARESLNKESK